MDAFRKKLQMLQYLDFKHHDRHDWFNSDISDEELERGLRKVPRPELFLGRYSIDDINDTLTRHGIFAQLEDIGFRNVQVEIKTDEVYNHRLYVHTGQKDYDHILIELRLREGVFRPRKQFVPEVKIGSLSMILVDWLLLQNPEKSFDEHRPNLPQQDHPGLGLLQSFIPMVMEVVNDSGRQGVLDVPIHYHGALFYSRWFHFFNPETEGKFLAMQRDLASLPLDLISHGISQGCLINLTTGEREKWDAGEQVLPLCDTLHDYFNHKTYMEARDEAYRQVKFDLDPDEYERMKKEIDGLERR